MKVRNTLLKLDLKKTVIIYGSTQYIYIYIYIMSVLRQ